MTVFAANLFNWCKMSFLDGENPLVNLQVLLVRVPIFVVSEGSMRPTMPCVSSIYFQWFLAEYEKRNLMADSVAKHLSIISSNATESERGIALKRFLGTRMTLEGGKDRFILNYQSFGETVESTIVLNVRDRVFTSTRETPKSCFDYRDGTLLSQTTG